MGNNGQYWTAAYILHFIHFLVQTPDPYVCFIYINNINLISLTMSFYFYYIYIIEIKNYVFYDLKWNLWVGI